MELIYYYSLHLLNTRTNLVPANKYIVNASTLLHAVMFCWAAKRANQHIVTQMRPTKSTSCWKNVNGKPRRQWQLSNVQQCSITGLGRSNGCVAARQRCVWMSERGRERIYDGSEYMCIRNEWVLLRMK